MKFSRFMMMALFPVFFLTVQSYGLPDKLEKLDILSKGYPRVFFFRSPEAYLRGKGIPFDQWESMFNQSGGIMGKVFNEEVPGIQERNIDYFTRFKKLNPNQMVLVHYNGNARDPRDGIENFFAGHWLYYNGCGVVNDLNAGEQISNLVVEDVNLFGTGIGRKKQNNDDIAICSLDKNGHPDWSRAEQLELISIDKEKNTLRVRRGSFGTKSLAWVGGKAYVAAHIIQGPWGGGNMLWFYNYSTTCPLDSKGLNCGQVLASELAEKFSKKGVAGALDGIEFDVSNYFFPLHRLDKPGVRGPDSDADGKADGGIVNGKNVYGVGLYEFSKRLRELMGPSKLILADGCWDRSQRCFGQYNGIESEGWPDAYDYEIKTWSSGINRNLFWNSRSFKPAFSFINHPRWVVPDLLGKGNRAKELRQELNNNFRLMRLPAAVCQMMDVFIATHPANDGKNEMGGKGKKVQLYDEYKMGQENRKNWLGMPLGPVQRLAFEQNDLYQNSGVELTKEFIAKIVDDDVSVKKSNLGLMIQPRKTDDIKFKWKLPKLELPGNDVVVSLKIRCEPTKGCPAEIARQVHVKCGPDQWLMHDRPTAKGFVYGDNKLRKLPELPDPYWGTAFIHWDVVLNDELHEAYKFNLVNLWQGCGVYWEENAFISQGSKLNFCTGNFEDEGDGITYRVIVNDGKEDHKIFEQHETKADWNAHSLDMSRWSGRKVTLRFLATIGEKNDSKGDIACWGDVYLADKNTGKIASALSSGTLMTFADNKEWFDASFYFRNIGPGPVTFTFQAEGTEPIYIKDIKAYSCPDVMIREFENGLVVANPSLETYKLDIGKRFAHSKFRRLKGSENQDTKVNNGQMVGDILDIPPRDAIFLVREPSVDK